MEEKYAQLLELCDELIGPIEYNYKIWEKHEPKSCRTSFIKKDLEDLHKLQRACEEWFKGMILEVTIPGYWYNNYTMRKCPGQEYPEDWDDTADGVARAYRALMDLASDR